MIETHGLFLSKMLAYLLIGSWDRFISLLVQLFLRLLFTLWLLCFRDFSFGEVCKGFFSGTQIELHTVYFRVFLWFLDRFVRGRQGTFLQLLQRRLILSNIYTRTWLRLCNLGVCLFKIRRHGQPPTLSTLSGLVLLTYVALKVLLIHITVHQTICAHLYNFDPSSLEWSLAHVLDILPDASLLSWMGTLLTWLSLLAWSADCLNEFI